MPNSIVYRAGKWRRRHPYGATFGLIAVALLAWSAWRLADERDCALRAEASAERESETARAVTSYLVELFREADPERARGARLTPGTLIDRGRERLEASRVPAPQRARLLGAFGEIYVNLGQPEKASAALEQALAEDPSLPATQRADLLQQLALASEARQRFVDTERHYREAVVLLWGASAPRELSDALAGLGLAYTRNDRNAEAESALRESIALRVEHDGDDAVDTLRYRVYLAEALFNAGRGDEARDLMDASIAMLRARLPPGDLELVASLGFYGVLLRDLGESAAAEAVFLEILAQRRQLLAHDSQKIALVHNNLGRVYYDQGRTLDATAQYQAAFDIGAREGAQQDPSRAIDMMNLGSLYEEVGDYARAEPLMRRGVAILEANPGQVGYLLALGRQNLGRLLMLAGQGDEARRWLELPIEANADRDWAMERGRQRIHLADWHRRYGDPAQAQRWLVEAQANLADIGGAESPRVAAILRVRGLLAVAAGDLADARRDLETAAATLAKARGERYVGVGELALELADLARLDGDPARAQHEGSRAHAILDPLLAASAPQRARMRPWQVKRE